jgi:hypothetical protein
MPAWMVRDGFQGVGEADPDKKWTKISQGLQPKGEVDIFECYQGKGTGNRAHATSQQGQGASMRKRQGG